MLDSEPGEPVAKRSEIPKGSGLSVKIGDYQVALFADGDEV